MTAQETVLKPHTKKLNEARQEGNEHGVFTIEHYIDYLEKSIDEYEAVLNAYQNIRKLNRILDQDMNEAIMM